MSRKTISIEQIAENALPLSQLLLQVSLQGSGDLLTAIIALEAAKRALLHSGEENLGKEFGRQARQLLQGFDGFEEMAKALNGEAKFVQPGGES